MCEGDKEVKGWPSVGLLGNRCTLKPVGRAKAGRTPRLLALKLATEQLLQTKERVGRPKDEHRCAQDPDLRKPGHAPLPVLPPPQPLAPLWDVTQPKGRLQARAGKGLLSPMLTQHL